MARMVPTSGIALVILLLAVAPGYITVAAWARDRTWAGPSSDLRMIIQALVLSAVVQTIISPLTVFWILPVRATLANYPWRITIWVVLSVIVVPVILGLVAAKVSDKIFDPSEIVVKGKLSKGVNAVVRSKTPPTAWDWLFTADRVPESGFLVIGFDDGSRVAGAFAEQSMALTSPEVRGLFLEQEWMLDEDANVVAELPGSQGLLIPRTDQVRWVRILSAATSTDREDFE